MLKRRPKRHERIGDQHRHLAWHRCNVFDNRSRAVIKSAGLDPKEWTPRELRHSFVSLLSSTGASIEDIAHLVGHRTTIVTQRIYRKELRPVLTRGAQAMDDIFDTRPPIFEDVRREVCLALAQVQDHLDSEWRSGGAPDYLQVLALKRAREAIGEAQDALGQATSLTRWPTVWPTATLE